MTQVNSKPLNTPLRLIRKLQNDKKQKESKKTKTSHQAQNRKQRKFLFFHDLQQLPINRQNCKSKPPKPAPLLQNNHRTTYHTTIDYLKAYHFFTAKEKSASCQHEADKMQIYICPNVSVPINVADTTLLHQSTSHRNKSYIRKIQPKSTYTSVDIAGESRTERHYS